jgi:hypothetical protein
MINGEKTQSDLENITNQSIELFLEFPSAAYLTQEGGQVVTSSPLPEDAAEEVIKTLTLETQAAVVLEVLQTNPSHKLYGESVFLRGSDMTFAEIVIVILRDAVAERMFSDQRVLDRADINGEKEAELNSEIKDKIKPIR